MRKKKNYTEAFKWANSELKTGRDIMSIVFSWCGTFPEEIIDYFEQAKEAGETKIVCEIRKKSKTIQEYERSICEKIPYRGQYLLFTSKT